MYICKRLLLHQLARSQSSAACARAEQATANSPTTHPLAHNRRRQKAPAALFSHLIAYGSFHQQIHPSILSLYCTSVECDGLEYFLNALQRSNRMEALNYERHVNEEVSRSICEPQSVNLMCLDASFAERMATCGSDITC